MGKIISKKSKKLRLNNEVLPCNDFKLKELANEINKEFRLFNNWNKVYEKKVNDLGLLLKLYNTKLPWKECNENIHDNLPLIDNKTTIISPSKSVNANKSIQTLQVYHNNIARNVNLANNLLVKETLHNDDKNVMSKAINIETSKHNLEELFLRDARHLLALNDNIIKEKTLRSNKPMQLTTNHVDPIYSDKCYKYYTVDKGSTECQAIKNCYDSLSHSIDISQKHYLNPYYDNISAYCDRASTSADYCQSKFRTIAHANKYNTIYSPQQIVSNYDNVLHKATHCPKFPFDERLPIKPPNYLQLNDFSSLEYNNLQENLHGHSQQNIYPSHSPTTPHSHLHSRKDDPKSHILPPYTPVIYSKRGFPNFSPSPSANLYPTRKCY